MAYGGETPKRQHGRSNWPEISLLDTGTLAKRVQRERTQFQTASVLMSNLKKRGVAQLSVSVNAIFACCHVAILPLRQTREGLEWQQKLEKKTQCLNRIYEMLCTCMIDDRQNS